MASSELLPELEIASERVVHTLAPDMDIGFRRIACLSFGHRTPSTRY